MDEQYQNNIDWAEREHLRTLDRLAGVDEDLDLIPETFDPHDSLNDDHED